MATITTSVVVESEASGASKRNRYRYTLDTGEVHERVSWIPQATDNAADLAVLGSRVLPQLAEAEYQIKIQRAATPVPLLYQTAAEFADRFRAEYKDATKVEAAQFAYWIIERINAGHLTDVQVRTAFALTAGQWTTLKSSKITPQHDFWVGVLAAVGQ